MWLRRTAKPQPMLSYDDAMREVNRMVRHREEVVRKLAEGMDR